MSAIRIDDPRLAPIATEATRLGYGDPREVGTGGGINAMLFDIGDVTYSVFLDADGRDRFAILRHTKRVEDEAFWSCQSACESHAFPTARDLASAVALFTTPAHDAHEGSE